MREFFLGESDGEKEYQEWLDEHPDGFVLSLTKNDQHKYTLHHACCKTISYNQVAAGHESRSGKICCEDMLEVEQWLGEHEDVGRIGVNRFCPQCH